MFHYFIKAVVCFHATLDILLIDRQTTTNLVDPYKMYCQFRDEDVDDEVIIDLPDLKGHNNWILFRDRFLSNPSKMGGSN